MAGVFLQVAKAMLAATEAAVVWMAPTRTPHCLPREREPPGPEP